MRNYLLVYLTSELKDMKREIDNEARNKRLDELSMKSFELDDICHEIWFTLMAYKRKI